MPAPPAPSPASTGPSDTTRSIVSFLLFLHLFAVAVAVLSRASPPQFAPPLEARLREVPGVLPYIALLGIDSSYTFFLVGMLHSGQPDFDHRIEVELQLADGKRETILLPDREEMHGAQRHRYELLVSNAVQLLQNPSTESRIPQAIVEGLARERSITGGAIRIRGKTFPQEAFGTIPQEYPPQPMYEARILVNGNQISLFKIDSATDSAPASGSTGAPPATK